MLVVAVTGEEVTPYDEECAGCGSILDGDSLDRTGVPGDDRDRAS